MHSTDSEPESVIAAPAPAGPSEREQKRLARRSEILGYLVYTIARSLFKTLRLECENLEGAMPDGKGSILVTWHGRSLIPANVFRGRGYWALISLSRDGEVQNQVFQRFGFQTIRGSTGRGGVKGALQMARRVKEGGVLTFTPDGPRGPTHKVQPGVILMAEKSGVPVVPIGVSASRRWLLSSWDSFMVPKPFSKAFMILGEPIYVPPKLSEADRVEFCVRIEQAINRLEKEAERRAGHCDYPAEWPTS
jgi:lysophospholipid acyltransferase (LPLAT)-like uncharacterized protein